MAQQQIPSNMFKRALILLGIAVMLGPAAVLAQKTTERFIPIGKSPGVSGKLSIIGRVESVDVEKRTLTVVNPEGRHTVKIPEACPIWLDCSDEAKTNEPVKLTACRKGLKVEVKFESPQKQEAAEWLKIEHAP